MYYMRCAFAQHKLIIGITLMFVAVFTSLILLSVQTDRSAQSINFYTRQDSEKPMVEVPESSFNMGKINVSDVKSKEFAIKNIGSKPLELFNISSSCGCTVGQIIYNGVTSKEYSMHAQSGLVTEIAPGDTAILRLTYRPATMPVYGLVEREVYVTTNDPVNQKLVFSIKAKVK